MSSFPKDVLAYVTSFVQVSWNENHILFILLNIAFQLIFIALSDCDFLKPNRNTAWSVFRNLVFSGQSVFSDLKSRHHPWCTINRDLLIQRPQNYVFYLIKQRLCHLYRSLNPDLLLSSMENWSKFTKSWQVFRDQSGFSDFKGRHGGWSLNPDYAVLPKVK